MKRIRKEPIDRKEGEKRDMVGFDYRGYSMTVAEYGEGKEVLFTFLTNLAVTKKNIKKLIEDGT